MGTKVSAMPAATAVNPTDQLMIVQGGVNKKVNASLSVGAIAAADLLTKIKTVDGAASGLDADLLDGLHAAAFATAAQGAKADSALQTAADFATAAQGVKADAALPAATYAGDHAATLAATGGQILPSGLIMKWGTTPVCGSGANPVSFASPFPNACFHVFLTPTASSTLQAGTDTISIAGFNVGYSGSPENRTFQYFAIGY